MTPITFKRHKYKCFYKYATAKVAKIALINRTIRWSSPVLFNDPFDVPRELNIGFKEKELLEAVADEVARIIENHEVAAVPGNPKLSALVQILRAFGSEELRRRLSSIVRNFTYEKANLFRETLNEFREHWERMIPQMRIICLSEINDSMSMWSHYADSHQGVVLALDCIEEIDSPWLIARPVIYKDAPPLLEKETLVRSITGQQPLDYGKFLLESMHIKTTDWEYEKEWQVVNFARPGESGLYLDYPIHPRNFGAVYLGQDISEEDEKDILMLLNHELSHVSAYKTVHILRERRLQFNKIR